MPQQALPSATTWKKAGFALMAVALTYGWVFSFVNSWIWGYNYKVLWAILYALSPTLLFSGAFLYWRGRQFVAQAGAESIITDHKSHLLYLRPFRSDVTTTKELLRAGLATTEEEQLADVLRQFGELVAIGRPGERLPTPGAARIYTSDEEWKDVVKRQMLASRLVVIRAAVGENVLWELTQAVRTLEPQKLLILILKMKSQDYESFRTKANPILGVSLPERTTVWRFGRVSGFISFAANWKPSFLVLKAPYFRSGSFKSPAMYALRPVFESAGLEWQPPPISVKQIVQLIYLVVVAPIAVLAVAIIILTFLESFLEWLGLLTISD